MALPSVNKKGSRRDGLDRESIQVLGPFIIGISIRGKSRLG